MDGKAEQKAPSSVAPKIANSRRLRPLVSSPPFAGRIGGNQEFVAVDASQLERQQDALPLQRLSDALRLDGFLNPQIWIMATIEGWGTCLLIFVFGAGASGLTTLQASPMALALYAALLNFVGLVLFVYAAAPASGGHLNPSITLATFFAGLCTLPRAVLYVVAQCTGAIVAGYWLRLALGPNGYFPAGVIPGCTVNPALISPGQLFVLEYFFAQALIFTSFGVGLDPRQANVFGPALAPVLVGATLALGTLASSVAKPGYTGLSFNSARCLGLMLAANKLQYHYIHWLATLSAAVTNGVFYYFAPPYVKDKPRTTALTSPSV